MNKRQRKKLIKKFWLKTEEALKQQFKTPVKVFTGAKATISVNGQVIGVCDDIMAANVEACD